MTNTLPERTAGPLELARESARLTGCECDARPGYTCDGEGGMHLARYAAAARAGLIGGDRMAAVLAAVPPRVHVPDDRGRCPVTAGQPGDRLAALRAAVEELLYARGGAAPRCGAGGARRFGRVSAIFRARRSPISGCTRSRRGG